MKVKILFAVGLAMALASWTGVRLVLAWPVSSQEPAVASAPALTGAAPGMQTHDVQALLYQIYNSAYQFGNAGSVLHPETWNTSSRKRALFYRQVNSLRGFVDALQKPWNGFYKDPANADLGRETLEALKKLMPEADSFAKGLADTAGESAAASYQKSATDLADLERQLEPYVNGLEAQAHASTKEVEAKSEAAQPQKPVAAAKTNANEPGAPEPSPAASPQAAQSSPSAAPATPAEGKASAPVSATSTEMQPHDVQALLYRLYNSAYQFGNAGTVLHPETWNTSSRKRAAFYRQANSLRGSVDALQKPWNSFYKDPGNADLGRETLGALNKLVPEADTFAKALADSAGTSVATGYQKSAADLAQSEAQLELYVTGLEAKAKAPESTKAVEPVFPSQYVTEAKSQPGQTPQGAGVKAETQPAAAPSTLPPAASAPPTPLNSPPATFTAPVGTASAPAPAPVAMSATEVQALLYKIYIAGYRITDLTGSLPLDKWKLSDQDRAALTEKSDSLRAALAAAEKPRSEFYSHPDDRGLGRATVSALQTLSLRLDDFQMALEGSPGASTVSDYRQSNAELGKLTQQLEPYIAYLEAKGSAGVGTLETEVVRPASTTPPLTGASAEQPPLNAGQIKTILDQANAPALRLKDMLNQEKPGDWKASDAQRSAFHDASQVLAERLAELDKWRTQFEAHPNSLEAAFEVYASLGKLTEPANTVGHLVGQYENPSVGNEYLHRAQQVVNYRDQLEPYLGYLLSAYDSQTGTVERNFRACETELSYAMRPSQTPATPMHNVNPVFQGHPATRHVNHAESSAAAHAHDGKAHEAKKPVKTPSEKPKQ